MTVEDRLQALDGGWLTPVVRRVLRSDGAVVRAWDVNPLAGGLGVAVGAGVPYRVAGTARERGVERPWSLVVKVLRPPSGESTHFNHPDPGHPSYWKREALVYGSGVLDGLPRGLTAPECFAIVEDADGVWLWLEEVVDAIGPRWPLATFGDAARHLGRFNGAYLAGRPLPVDPWLSAGLLRPRGERSIPFWDEFPAWRDHPQFRRVWPGTMADRVFRLWEEREHLLAALERLPLVLCHADGGRRNLFARRGGDGGPETVAIDWAFLGRGAVGEECAPLVMASILLGEGLEPDDVPALSRACYAGYLAGLRDAGWAGDERLVRLGYAAATALRFGPFSGFVDLIGADDALLASEEPVTGAPFDAVLDRFAALQPFVLALADEARDLLAAV
jgi:hypothetical protein